MQWWKNWRRQMRQIVAEQHDSGEARAALAEAQHLHRVAKAQAAQARALQDPLAQAFRRALGGTQK